MSTGVPGQNQRITGHWSIEKCGDQAPATPNPFNPSTTITFEVPRAGRVTLSVAGGEVVHRKILLTW